jgi:aspartate 1-decarboxylase
VLRTFISAKLHGLRVTDKALDYHGSATLPKSLMELVDIQPYEQVHCANKANGNRWVTYALPGPEGKFTLNGAAARYGEIGDECLIFTYRQEEVFSGAIVAFLGPDNRLAKTERYPATTA